MKFQNKKKEERHCRPIDTKPEQNKRDSTKTRKPHRAEQQQAGQVEQ
jgi:hypothetical protein